MKSYDTSTCSLRPLGGRGSGGRSRATSVDGTDGDHEGAGEVRRDARCHGEGARSVQRT